MHPVRIRHTGTIVGFIVLLTVFGLIGLDDELAQKSSLCPSMRFFGIPCPGCGMTKAAVAVLHGQVGESLRINPLGLIFILGGGCTIVLYIRDLWTGRNSLEQFLNHPYIWIFGSLGYVIYYLYKLYGFWMDKLIE